MADIRHLFSNVSLATANGCVTSANLRYQSALFLRGTARDIRDGSRKAMDCGYVVKTTDPRT
jgi:hypothetical protein